MAKSALLAFAAALGGVLVVDGCNAIAGIEDPINGAPSGAGVTGDARFFGTWTSTMPKRSVSQCILSIDNSNPLSLTISSDATGPYVSPAGTTCKIRVAIAGNVLTALANQSCSERSGTTNLALDYDPRSTFTLLDQSGTTAQAVIGAAASINGTICEFAENDTYAKDP